MKEDSVVELKMKGPIIDDAITDTLRKEARQLLAQALEADIELFISQFAGMRDEQGRQRVVRNCYHRQRDIQSSILPAYLRKTKSLEELIPWLYLKGVSTGDFSDALCDLLGKDAPGLSAATISRLKTI